MTKESTDSEIKKAYKKLALQMHPDKNKAPGAVEAFKAIGNAVAVLTDPEKRKSYDLYGKDEQQFVRRGNNFNHGGYRQHEYAYARGFESEFTAEELFNMFFGGGFPQQAAQTRYRRQQYQHEAQTVGRRASRVAIANRIKFVLGTIEPRIRINFAFHHCIDAFDFLHIRSDVQLVAKLVSFIIRLVTVDEISKPNSLIHSKYPVERKTLNHRISYYVKENFGTEYQGSLGRLESAVEEEYIVNMKRACFSEKNYRELPFDLLSLCR